MIKYNIREVQEKEVIWKFYLKNGWKKTQEKYGVSRSTISSWKRRIANASPSNKHPLARRYLIGPEIIAYYKKLHKENPTLSLERLRRQAILKYKISRTSIWHIVHER